MPLSGHILRIGMQGVEVKLLHSYLKRLGYEAQISKTEIENATFEKGTAEAVAAFQQKNNVPLSGDVDAETAKAINRAIEALTPEPESPSAWVVKGHLRRADGRPSVGMKVQAFDRDLRSEEPLGGALTAGDGRYEISYTAEQFRRAEKQSADLIVRAFPETAEPITSAIIFNAPRVAVVDLVIASDKDDARSEYERYLEEIAPLLENVKVNELTADDVAFLAGETGIDQQHLAFLVVAARHGEKAQLPAEPFYGFAREGLPTSLPALLAQGTDNQRRVLLSAIDTNVIPARLKNEVEKILAELGQRLVESALQDPDTATKTPLGALLSMAIASTEKQHAFLSVYSEHKGPIEEFWKALRGHPEFTEDGDVERLQLTLQLGALTQDNAPLVGALRKAQPDLRSTQELVDVDVEAWQRLIRESSAGKEDGIPPDIPGKTPDEKIANYAASIIETLRSAFATRYVAKGLDKAPAIDAALVKRVLALNEDLDPRKPLPAKLDWGRTTEEDEKRARAAFAALRDELLMFPELRHEHALAGQGFTNPIRAGVQQVLKNDTTFDFGAVNIAEYLKNHRDTAFAGIDESQHALVSNQLEAMQRVYQVTPRYEDMHALMSKGLNAAREIASYPPEPFIEEMRPLVGGEKQARFLYENAERIHAEALTAYGVVASAERDLTVRVIGNGRAPRAMRPTYPSLFGALDLCACEHCRSVYSPAAYLVDLLQFLNRGPWQLTLRGPVRPITVLQWRRPDVLHILLTCENTNTLIPYVDLVNEILEAYIVDQRVPDRSLGDTGTATSEELLASPQRLEDAAYDAVRRAVFPFTLPFDRSLETVRVYLQHLGASRYEVMRTFQRRRPLIADAQIDLAVEYLKIGPDERDTLTGAIFGGSSPRTIAELYGYEATTDGLPPADLETVAVFLERTDLTYDELALILRTRFINPAGPQHKNAVVIVDPDNRCDAAQRYLRLKKDAGATTGRSLAQDDWDRLQRFIRLWRRLGWTINDVDRALAALGVTDASGFDLRLLRRLGEAVQLRDDLRLSLDETLSLWATIDTLGNHDMVPHVGSLYARLFLNRTVTELAADPRAFELNPAAPAADEHRRITANNTAIQGALRISADELAAVRDLENLSDQASAEPPRFPLVTLEHLSALHRYPALARALRMTVRDLLDLRILTGVNPFAPPPPTPGNGNPTEQEGTARFVELARKVQRSGFSVALLNYVYKGRIDTARGIGLRPEQILEPLTRLYTDLRNVTRNEGTEAVVQGVARALGLEPGAARVLLTHALDAGGTPGQPAIADFLALRDDFTPPADRPAALADFPRAARESFSRLHKSAVLMTTFRLTARELDYLAGHASEFGGFSLNDLPANEPSDEAQRRTVDAAAPAAFASWERVYNLMTLRERVTDGDDLIAVFATASIDAAKGALLEATGWDRQSLDSALGADGFDVIDRAFFASEVRLLDLAAALDLAKRLGVSPSRLFAWAATAADGGQAREVQSAVKARYDAQQWLVVAKRLNDPLRERRRDALVAHILTLPPLRSRRIMTADELFEFFLIDVKMNACMATSRIKQAIASVQLFIQRCFLKLEDDVPANALRTDWWEWMSTYRVWEANRKVFLYPENWIEPDLRDDKSPFFKELENELLQNDVTDETAEAALLGYLEKLDEVARLDIRATYWEHESELTWDDRPAGGPVGNGTEGARLPDAAERADVLHVFARTRGLPPRYYYRQLIDRHAWTPWEKMHADIEGDHLIPVIYNRRLYLFWPIFRETTAPPSNGAGPAERRLEIELAWTEYKDGTWSAKKVAKETLRPTYVIAGPDPRFLYPTVEPRSDYFFDAREVDDWLVIECGYHYRDAGAMSRVGHFTFIGCKGDVIATTLNEPIPTYVPIPSRPPADRLARPNACFVHGQQFGSGSLPSELKMTRSIESGAVVPLLELDTSLAAANPYRVVYSHQYAPFELQAPFFYQDRQRVYFVTPEQVERVVSQVRSPGKARPHVETGKAANKVGWSETVACADDRPGSAGELRRRQSDLKFRFHTFFHPHVCAFVRALNRRGVPELLSLDCQRLSDLTESGAAPADPERLVFRRRYRPSEFVDRRYPRENVDFEDGAYALYNWELFFHVPLLIATRLAANQRFAEARRWFHFIFDPTTDSSDPIPQRFWKTLPLYRNSGAPQERITDLLRLLSHRGDDLSAQDAARREQIRAQVREWRDDPFSPHHLASLRPTAYQKTVVMKYIDNLIAWGDQLFRRDTIEAINEATQLYVLAWLMLGKRPDTIAPKEKPAPQSYAQLRPRLDEFSNALVATENALSGGRCVPLTPRRGKGAAAGATLGTLYFCVPHNDKLLGYWNTVEDRLFKVRHCMNIEGAVRQLPLFEPPIDPALLVRARAAGVDLRSVLDDSAVRVPHYRFTFTLQKAAELCAEVRSLGSALLGAVEKKDGEELALLRSTQEIRSLEQVRLVRQKQIEEADESIAGLQRSRDVVEARQRFYSRLMTVFADQRDPQDVISVSTPLNQQEKLSLVYYKSARDWQVVAGSAEVVASILHIIPTLSAPGGGSGFGGQNLGSAAQAVARVFSLIGAEHTYLASHASTIGSHVRRGEEWTFQEAQASRELAQIDKQIDAARIRQAVALQELRNHDLQVENARAVDEFMRSRKFSRKELYDWMVTQLSAVYFQAYQLAYDMAKRAEQAYRFERGLKSSSIVRFGHWDSLRQGLLAGEQLTLDLKRLEAAYIDQNRRDYEISKSVSVVLLDPLALIALKATGRCIVRLPEALFDLDYPGHYIRRIRNVSLTIPCVRGPYTGINCTLTLLTNTVRVDSSVAEGYPERTDGDDDRFVRTFGAVQSIATSHGQNDSGTFDLNFRDERYLPFEGAGVVSEWQIDLPKDCNAFDFDTIADVVIHLGYTSRQGGDDLRRTALAAAVMPAPPDQPGRERVSQPTQPNLRRVFSTRHEFADAWHRFLYTGSDAAPHPLQLALTRERFPFTIRGRVILVKTVEVFLTFRQQADAAAREGLSLVITPPGLEPNTATLESDPTLTDPMRNDLLRGMAPSGADEWNVQPGQAPWTLTLVRREGGTTRPHRIPPDDVGDIVVVCHYSVLAEA